MIGGTPHRLKDTVSYINVTSFSVPAYCVLYKHEYQQERNLCGILANNEPLPTNDFYEDEVLFDRDFRASFGSVLGCLSASFSQSYL